LKESGSSYPRVELVRSILKNIEDHYLLFKNGDFAAIIKEWKDLSAVLGKHVKISGRDRVIEGQAIDIDKGGALIVRLDNGMRERILAGDVTLAR
jgi:BirA family biotin operon repressor/biotin-[acetyl-CoA-carboxylase] ligase